ncbi:acetyl/propionyl/methylcrotonyl-CoA carboxylase subunit alpha [Craterilacuibacter sp. RT1T]|uniref:acetyl/propionyl/methylcrotonyl-CoA carboxylase subunit alpha n=1 Tax=Craterilacuibacter sp. RT1T TaxID=2942211 RepID=UPI0020C01EE0|nr:acetyl/propionyl/methylcrotonyl-CoA carboxylase subunit alpha [Craterilacuibacter sp. RT1T]MCL6262659.1 acetyl/propionyl/methylcrotonyl-CoA carboxylase subunit alpha [Craterilacuibacter sp. RT1T]
MLAKILIANRGEIACRIIRSARALGIASVAVYSEADANAQHVRLADEAVAIGAAAAAESYLRADKIIAAALSCGADAIHPGYGFLSENAAFARDCSAAGLIFIGPPASAIEAMGSKSAAKRLMADAGVPLVPGYHGENQDDTLLAAEATRIGYPVLIKAVMGGGGKGMRVVESGAEFAAALASCRREAQAAFGNDVVLLEKYLQRPRHIEIQLFADSHGHAVYLFERDCSAQRRHQKVIEEAPAPNLAAATRRAMGEAACAAARAVGYVGAGTVEFIVEPDGRFYFMEMNTRLQVEHPVTEMITGQDLVAWQIRVAAGEALPLAQDDIPLSGHAFEARIYAEDPDKGFLPATGTLTHLRLPQGSARVRLDSGVIEGDTISPWYDPMIAKLIVWGETRDIALQSLRHALAQCEIAGVACNTAFLARLAAHPDFAAGSVDTGLIARAEAELLPGATAPASWQLALLSLAEALDGGKGWRLNGTLRRHFDWQVAGQLHRVSVDYLADGFTVTTASACAHARASLDQGELTLWLDGQRHQARVIRHGHSRTLFSGSERLLAQLADPYAYASAETQGHAHLRAPMPGRVLAHLSNTGSHVTQGTPLLILEAMKMEHTLRAPADGVVKAYLFHPGEQVSDGDELVDFETMPQAQPA